MARSVHFHDTHDADAEGEDNIDTAIQRPIEQRLVTIEHPCIVKNLDKGLRSLGDESRLIDVLDHKLGDSQIKVNGKPSGLAEPMIGVSLRPGDVFAKRIPSVAVQTRNILVKVTLPKCVGRKRKRVSNEPNVASNMRTSTSEDIGGPELVRRLQDNQDSYYVRAMGMIRDTHRFRNLPDVQLGVSDLPIMRELKEHVLGQQYDSLKNLHIDKTPGVCKVTEYPGPPSFLGIEQPYPYGYQQAAGVVFKMDERGNMVSENKTAAPKRGVEAVACDVTTVPSHAPSGLVMRDRAKSSMLETIKTLKKLLEQRPLVSKRVMIASLPQHNGSLIKEATQWTGYSFKNGPFRDLHIKYGVDPRSHPRYRIYQALTFHHDQDDPTLPANANSAPDTSFDHIFDGKRLSLKGKTWQVCDVTDPVVQQLFATAPARDECDISQSGWYSDATLTKARVIMRDKISRICAGDILPDSVYEPLLLLPDDGSESTSSAWLDEGKYGKATVQLATKIRSSIRAAIVRRQYEASKEQGTSYNDAQNVVGDGSASGTDDGDDDGGDFDEDVAEDAEDVED